VTLERFRHRLPRLVFLLIALVCLVLLGFVCACFTDQPAQALERVRAAISAVSAVLEVWPFVVAFVASASLVASRRVVAMGLSPPVLSVSSCGRL